MGQDYINKEIIKYWYLLEFLNQSEFPKTSKNSDNESKNSDNENKNSDNKNMNIVVSHEFDVQSGIFPMIQNDKSIYKKQPITSDNIDICLGKISREACMKQIYSLFNQKDDRIDKTYGNIALFGLQITIDQKYIGNSFNLSPLIWVMNQIKMHPQKALDEVVDINDYEKSIEVIEKWLQRHHKINDDILHMLFDKVSEVFLSTVPNLPNVMYEGVFFYQRFKDEVAKEKRDFPLGYSSLSLNFFANDLKLLQELMNQDVFRKNDYYKSFISPFISCALDQSKEFESIELLKSDKGKTILEDALHIGNAPLGKWPSCFSPCFMQQFAINLSIKNEEHISRHISVNGPPGTGKTTMLKEIIAETIVRRAILLLDYDKANDAFEKSYFKDGDSKYNGYHDTFSCYYKPDSNLAEHSILVASSNNTAVENITKELPEGEGMCNGLRMTTGCEENDTELMHLYNKFSQSEEDVYFTKYAKDLFNEKNDKPDQQKYYWGLISAPLGKKENRSKLISVLYDMLRYELGNKENYEERNVEYQTAKKEFVQQLRKVIEIRNQICKACDAEKSLLAYVKQQEEDIKVIESNIAVHENQKNELERKIESCRISIKNLESEKTSLLNNIEELNLQIQKIEKNHAQANKTLGDTIEAIKQQESSRSFIEFLCILFHIKTMKQQELDQLYQQKISHEKAVSYFNDDLEKKRQECSKLIKHSEETKESLLTYLEELDYLDKNKQEQEKTILDLESGKQASIQNIKQHTEKYNTWTLSMRKDQADNNSYTILDATFWKDFYSDDIEKST